MGNTRIGIAIGGPLDTLGETAKRVEDAGFESIWVPETARTAYISAAVVAQATSRARIGTGIALAFPRSPVITAMTARDLAELSGGRFILGLGTQVKRVNELRYSTPFEHPAPKMRELIDVCRGVWGAFDGAPIDHRGRFYTVTMPPFPGAGPAGPIPIHLAAVNHEMVRLVGERCDGFLGHPFSSPKFLSDVALPSLHEGLDAAGRKRDEVEVVQSIIVSIADTTEEALVGAKLQIAFYGTTRTYAKVFEIHGWGDVVGPLRAAHGRGDFAGMIECITDEMCDEFAAAGTADEVRDKVRKFDGLADTVLYNPPWAAPDIARTADVYERIVDVLAPR
ncbi:MAG TPA: TIGR03617 family F420-dependent LLM class oxidoreductase [Actinomycetota bacterium]|nr:TIGR03617 family F420-dependent LLM class oxidoreductase [Actinomycetota bacterium]